MDVELQEYLDAKIRVFSLYLSFSNLKLMMARTTTKCRF
jgi:hypothetical protein